MASNSRRLKVWIIWHCLVEHLLGWRAVLERLIGSKPVIVVDEPADPALGAGRTAHPTRVKAVGAHLQRMRSDCQ